MAGNRWKKVMVFITIVGIWDGEQVGIAFLSEYLPSESCGVEADPVIQIVPLFKGDYLT